MESTSSNDRMRLCFGQGCSGGTREDLSLSLTFIILFIIYLYKTSTYILHVYNMSLMSLVCLQLLFSEALAIDDHDFWTAFIQNLNISVAAHFISEALVDALR